MVFLLVKHTSPAVLDFETNLIFKEFALLYVIAARSWIPFRHLSPDCYRVPFDAVLRRYVEWDEVGLDGEDVDFAVFWEELLEEHGFESDRQWLARQREHLPTARELAIGWCVPQIQAPNGKESWRGKPVIEFMHDPEFWEIFPSVDILTAIQNEEERRHYPHLYGEIKPKRKRSTGDSIDRQKRARPSVQIVYCAREWEEFLKRGSGGD